MILPYLITVIIILGAIVSYIKFIAPRINPLNKAENFISQDMIDEAIIEYKKILDKNPANFIVHFKLAEIYFNSEDFDQGVIHLEKVLHIGQYNYEIEKKEVQRRLAKVYLLRQETEKAFEQFFEILKSYPQDKESLYHVSFIALGQEFFEFALKTFNKLAPQAKRDFEIYFGAGIANYQNHQTEEAINHFKNALNVEPHSDIANLAMAFSLQRKRDFKTAVNYCKMIIDNSNDHNAVFLAKRLLGILNIQLKKGSEGVKLLEELLGEAKQNDMPEEIPVLLYDLGFTCLKAEMTEVAYEYWNELYQIERNFKDVQLLITMLRKEMDDVSMQGQTSRSGSVIDFADNWLDDAFPANYLWNICGLKSSIEIDIKPIITAVRTGPVRTDGSSSEKESISDSAFDRIEKFCNIDVEKFRIISNRVVSKLGYNVDEILQTYRENDGVDFIARSNAEKGIKALVWIRRWKGVQVGEIPLRNFAQAINDMKVNLGLFISASDLTESGEEASSRLSKVTVVPPETLAELLNNLI